MDKCGASIKTRIGYVYRSVLEYGMNFIVSPRKILVEGLIYEIANSIRNLSEDMTK
jgi:hypothetical protein